MWMQFFWVAIGGCLGAILRYGSVMLTLSLFGDRLPYGTFLVNVAGCFLAGALIVWLAHHFPESSGWRVFWMFGVLGAFTTFSAFSVEMVFMIEAHRWAAAFAYAFFSLSVCLLATVAGMMLVRRML